MVRTVADGGRKAVGAKAPRKQVGGSSDSAGSLTSPSKNSSSGGNPIRWWPTPEWQKGVGDFFPKINKDRKATEMSDNSTSETSSTSDINQPGVSNKELEIKNLESEK